MTTFYDVHDLESQVNHLIGELKDARIIMEEYIRSHSKYNAGIKCGCDECKRAGAWLARNRNN